MALFIILSILYVWHIFCIPVRPLQVLLQWHIFSILAAPMRVLLQWPDSPILLLWIRWDITCLYCICTYSAVLKFVYDGLLLNCL